MAKELYDGIYSSHKQVFIERIEKILDFHLSGKIRQTKILGQEIFCEVAEENLYDTLKELRENPELDVNVLNSINKYISGGRYVVLLSLSSLPHNFSMLIKSTSGKPHPDKESFTGEYNDLIVKISAIYNSALFYLEHLKAKEDFPDIIIKSQPLDGLDAFDVYLRAEQDFISEVNINTIISLVPLYSIVKNISITELITKISRFDYSAGIFPELCFCIALEELMQLKVSRRVQYIRMIISEISRISSHLDYISKMAMMLGSEIALSRVLIERERFLRLIEFITGSRIHPNYIRIGGVRKDLSEERIKNISLNMQPAFKNITGIEALLLDNTIITCKLKNIGIADRDMTLRCGVTGPNLRASGARYDLRKNRNLLLYKNISFLAVIGKYGDCLERLQIRFREIYQSINIINQLVSEIPEEHIRKLINLADLDMPFTEMVSSIECPHGVFKIFFEIKGNRVLRLVVMGPSRNSLYLAENILPGNRVEDAELILASLDLSSGEIMQELPL